MLRASFDACQRYVACVDMLRYSNINVSRVDDSVFSHIPTFTLQIKTLQIYEEEESKAMQQSRSNYQFNWTPVQKEIENANE